MKSSNNKWQDHYARRAQKERYAARSVYKLAEIQKKHRIIRKGDRILDLGCAPGSWIQFAVAETGEHGQVVGIDLKPITLTLPPNVRVVTGDINEIIQSDHPILKRGFKVVLSDMAPATIGNKHADAARSFALCETALAVVDKVLQPSGHFVVKIFQGEDFKTFCDRVKIRFDRMQIFKPQSSRKGSKEIFIIGLGKK
jgi:23S rRNA (uridine2552-2'-O)-methyltransferase